MLGSNEYYFKPAVTLKIYTTSVTVLITIILASIDLLVKL